MYRYGFNGKENDSDFGNQLIQDYGFRLYNPAIAKFLSVDPLSPEYPELTPYQFASNRVIDGIDLDGLEYLEARYTDYRIKSGQTWLKPARFQEVFGKNAGLLSGSIRTDHYGNEYIGPTAPVQRIQYSEGTPYRSISPIHSNALRNNMEKHINEELLGEHYQKLPRRKDGHPDRRYNVTKTYYKTEGKVAGFGKVGIAYMTVDIAIQTVNGVKSYIDFVDDQEQLDYLQKSLFDVNKAVKQGLVDPKYQNMEDLSKLANFIFQGEPIEDPALQNLAKYITENISKNLKYELMPLQDESGLDSYPSRRHYIPDLDYMEKVD